MLKLEEKKTLKMSLKGFKFEKLSLQHNLLLVGYILVTFNLNATILNF